MKTASILIAFLASIGFYAHAQDAQREGMYRMPPAAQLKIYSTDGSPLLVTINDRRFKTIAETLYVNDLPNRRLSLQLYRHIPANNGKARAELLYSGSIKIKNGFRYEAVYDARTRNMKINRFEGTAIPTNTDDRPARDNRVGYNPDRNKEIRSQPQRQGMNEVTFTQLKDRVEKIISDSDRLKLLEATLPTITSISTNQVAEILKLLAFDSSRLTFLKGAYPKLSDVENAAYLAENLSFSSTQEDYYNFMKAQ